MCGSITAAAGGSLPACHNNLKIDFSGVLRVGAFTMAHHFYSVGRIPSTEM